MLRFCIIEDSLFPIAEAENIVELWWSVKFVRQTIPPNSIEWLQRLPIG
jgi:hypothetical protein